MVHSFFEINSSHPFQVKAKETAKPADSSVPQKQPGKPLADPAPNLAVCNSEPGPTSDGFGSKRGDEVAESGDLTRPPKSLFSSIFGESEDD